MRRFVLLLSCALSAQVQFTSPLGKKFEARPDEKGAVAAADAALAKQPASAELLLAAARARDELWRYSESIPLYTRGIKDHPADFRFPRFRGHRYISLRQFDRAISDLQQARQLAPGSFDVAYHLGLAHYLKGQFDRAATEYGRCLAMLGKPAAAPALPKGVRHCAELSEDENSRVALIEWRYRALRRAGKTADAEALLETVSDDMKVESNEAYFESLLMYKGMRTGKQLLDPARLTGNRFPTVAYALGNYYLLEGQRDKACAMFTRVLEDPAWSAFGFIAAEAEVSRGACKD